MLSRSHGFDWVFFGISSLFLFLSDAQAAPPPANNGVFSEDELPESCYAIRRTERSGYEKYYNGDLYIDPVDKVGAATFQYPSVHGESLVPITSREVAYSDVLSNHAVDILCVGDQITITKNLYSNGGNVFIFANSLVVQAPIDTRIYYDIANRNRYFRDPQNFGEPYDTIIKSYFQDNPESKFVGSETFAPEFPGGSLIKISDYFTPADGSPAPVIPTEDRILSRSGTISVFAKSIQIAEPLTHGSNATSQFCAKAAPFAFQAGGARGGKGGIGSFPGCWGKNPSGFSCGPSALTTSGNSSMPGPGGDGGNIYLYQVDKPFSTQQKQSLIQASNVTGGVSGPTAKYRTIDVVQLAAGGSSNVCSWTPIGSYASPGSGVSGTLRFGSSTVLQALEQADLFAGGVDSRTSTDYNDLIIRARATPSLQFGSMIDFLRSRLSRIGMAVQKAWADQLANQMISAPVTEKPSIEPFSSISKDYLTEKNPQLSQTISSLARVLANLDISGGPNLAASYFGKVGGAFNITNPKATIGLVGTYIEEDLATIIEIDNDQLEALNSLESTVNQSLYTTRQAEIVQHIESVQQRISQLNSLAQKNGASFLDIANSIQRNAPAIGGFVAAVYNEDYVTAAKAFPSAIAGLNDIYNTAYTTAASPPIQDLTALNSAVRALQAALQDLNDAYSASKQELLGQNYSAAKQELEARHRLASSIDDRLILGGDLIKHSFVAYFVDPQNDVNTFVRNLQETALYLSGKTDYRPLLSLPPISGKCQAIPAAPGQATTCITLQPSQNYRFVQTKIFKIQFPAWVVAPAVQSRNFPTYNAPTTITIVRH